MRLPKRVFYTAHYHTMIAPTLYCDVNGEYRGMNDMIYTDPKKANYTTLSLWDTYRCLESSDDYHSARNGGQCN